MGKSFWKSAGWGADPAASCCSVALKSQASRALVDTAVPQRAMSMSMNSHTSRSSRNSRNSTTSNASSVRSSATQSAVSVALKSVGPSKASWKVKDSSTSGVSAVELHALRLIEQGRREDEQEANFIKYFNEKNQSSKKG